MKSFLHSWGLHSLFESGRIDIMDENFLSFFVLMVLKKRDLKKRDFKENEARKGLRDVLHWKRFGINLRHWIGLKKVLCGNICSACFCVGKMNMMKYTSYWTVYDWMCHCFRSVCGFIYNLFSFLCSVAFNEVFIVKLVHEHPIRMEI